MNYQFTSSGYKLTDLDSINIGGLGIHLIKKMVDDVNYKRSNGKNKVMLRKKIK
jgi:serine/threonine-protein kinase RsbW